MDIPQCPCSHRILRGLSEGGLSEELALRQTLSFTPPQSPSRYWSTCETRNRVEKCCGSTVNKYFQLTTVFQVAKVCFKSADHCGVFSSRLLTSGFWFQPRTSLPLVLFSVPPPRQSSCHKDEEQVQTRANDRKRQGAILNGTHIQLGFQQSPAGGSTGDLVLQKDSRVNTTCLDCIELVFD